MDFTDEAVQTLARRMYGSDGGSVSSREEMEELLVPMIRCVLRTGRGQPLLRHWVERNLPAVALASPPGQVVKPEWAAPRMARLLCSQMLQVQADQGRAATHETVVGR